MGKVWLIVIAAIVLFVLSVVADNRIAAGGGALLLLIALIWAYVHNRRGSRANMARAEAGARDLREELEEEDERRGT